MKNFKQFTTALVTSRESTWVFMMVQRWRISSNSQLLFLLHLIFGWCLWWFKDEEFQAIHNKSAHISIRLQGVYDGSKMKNFKQFTTQLLQYRIILSVFMMVQRWRISSNSQQAWWIYGSFLWCLWWFKDEEFQAIHNTGDFNLPRLSGVYDGSKMKNFKQFTTFLAGNRDVIPVFMMVQRWRISSNSQHNTGEREAAQGCLWWFKDEEFQAIHNVFLLLDILILGVYDGSKMKNFKQFTTFRAHFHFDVLVFMMVQRWRISSNSQPISIHI